MLSGYKGEVEIKNKYFKFKESYYLLDNNITRIDFKYMPKSEISHWTGDYIDNVDEKTHLLKMSFHRLKRFSFINSTAFSSFLVCFSFLWYLYLLRFLIETDLVFGFLR